jgi:hypothetical protein
MTGGIADGVRRAAFFNILHTALLGSCREIRVAEERLT